MDIEQWDVIENLLQWVCIIGLGLIKRNKGE